MTVVMVSLGCNPLLRWSLYHLWLAEVSRVLCYGVHMGWSVCAGCSACALEPIELCMSIPHPFIWDAELFNLNNVCGHLNISSSRPSCSCGQPFMNGRPYWTVNTFLLSVVGCIDPVNTFLLSEVGHVGPVCVQIPADMLCDIHWHPNLYHGAAQSS